MSKKSIEKILGFKGNEVDKMERYSKKQISQLRDPEKYLTEISGLKSDKHLLKFIFSMIEEDEKKARNFLKDYKNYFGTEGYYALINVLKEEYINSRLLLEIDKKKSSNFNYGV